MQASTAQQARLRGMPTRHPHLRPSSGTVARAPWANMDWWVTRRPPSSAEKVQCSAEAAGEPPRLVGSQRTGGCRCNRHVFPDHPKLTCGGAAAVARCGAAACIASRGAAARARHAPSLQLCKGGHARGQGRQRAAAAARGGNSGRHLQENVQARDVARCLQQAGGTPYKYAQTEQRRHAAVDPGFQLRTCAARM